MESELLHKQLALLEHELQAGKQAAPATSEQRDTTAATAPASSQDSDLNPEQQLRILMVCANTAERRAKQLEEELARVWAAVFYYFRDL